MTSARSRLLIVEDEPAVAEVLAEHLKETYDVEVAHGGVDALGAVLRARPDVVLLDIQMPGMNGIEVLKSIKQIDDSIVVIMVTANEDLVVSADALKSGAFGYVPKPFDLRYLDHLLAVVPAGKKVPPH